jgi:hypothetical protein
VARYPVDHVDKVGARTRPVAAWALFEGGDGAQEVVGLTSDYEVITDYNGASGRPPRLANRSAPRLVRCDELPGFIGYDRQRD